VPSERVERKLAAILAADVAGYSRLIGTDEEGTLNRLKGLHKELIDPKVAIHQGRVVKLMGDGNSGRIPERGGGVALCDSALSGLIPEYDPTMKVWLVPFPMEPINTKNVH
jgi:class 3 adenylate cyclase